MQVFDRVVTGSEGTQARLTGYVIDNFEEMGLERTRPTIVILPGGGYEYLSDREAEPVALKMVGYGFNAFVLRYSVAPVRYPAALTEVGETIRTIREHAREWNVNPDAIIVAGFSAGGHLAADLATMWNRPVLTDHFDAAQIKPNGLLLGYPVITSGTFAHRGSFDALLGERKADPAVLEEVSLEKQVSADNPPTFLWHTVTDDIVPIENSTLFTLALKEHGVSVEAHLYPKGGHGLSLGTAETAIPNGYGVEQGIQSWPDLFRDWVLRQFPALT